RHLFGRGGGERAGAELGGAAVGVAEPLQRLLALAGGGEGDPGPQFDLRPLVRGRHVAVQLDRAGEVLGGAGGVAFEQGQLADRLGERRDGVVVAALGGHLPQRRRAELGVLAPSLLGEPARRPADSPDRVVVVLALLPAGKQLAAAAGRLVLEPFGGGDDRQRGGRVDVHVVVADRGGDGARGAQQ